MLPVGSIIASILDYKTFCIVNDMKPDLNERSIWFPCDGRLLPKCKYAGTGATNTPDLRGLFSRGVNEMIPNNLGAPALKPEQKNPENNKANDFQLDSLKSHTHLITGRGGLPGIGSGHGNIIGGEKGPFINAMDPTSVTGEDETRPKNISVYYYIKIN